MEEIRRHVERSHEQQALSPSTKMWAKYNILVVISSANHWNRRCKQHSVVSFTVDNLFDGNNRKSFTRNNEQWMCASLSWATHGVAFDTTAVGCDWCTSAAVVTQDNGVHAPAHVSRHIMILVKVIKSPYYPSLTKWTRSNCSVIFLKSQLHSGEISTEWRGRGSNETFWNEFGFDSCVLCN